MRSVNPDDRPLEGRTLLVTRAPSEWTGLSARLAALGAMPEFRATIRQMAPADTSAVATALDSVGRYAWILVTSPAGARFFDEAARGRGVDPGRCRARLAAVGRGTARALSALGWAVDLVAPSARAEGLAEALAGRIAKGESALWVRPENPAADLQAYLAGSGAAVLGVVFYVTVPSDDAPGVAADILARRYDAVLWTSPSSLAAVLDGAGARRGEIVAALRAARGIALGPTTAAALARAGLAADAVAEEPSEEELTGVFLRVLAR